MALMNAFESMATEAKLELVRALLASLDTKIITNDEGRIRVSTMPGRYALEEGVISASGQSFAVNVESVSNIMIHCKANPSVAGHTAVFEGSLDSTDGLDGTWFTVQSVRSNANTIETGCSTLAATPIYAWELSVNALRWARIRCTAHTSGSMKWMIQPGSYATEPIPANQVSSVTASTRSAGSWWTETTTNLAAGATFVGSNRACGTTSAQYFKTMRVRISTSHGGKLSIKCSRDTTAGNFRAGPESFEIQILAGVRVIDVPVLAYYARVEFQNTEATTTTHLEILSALFD